MPQPQSDRGPGLAELDRWDQLPRLQEMLAVVLTSNPFWRERLQGAPIPRDAEGFRRLPLTSNRDLSADAGRHLPFGSNLTYPLDRYCRFHQTSGTIGSPLTVLDTPESWAWWCDCWDSVFDTCQVRAGERAFFAFSFGPFIGFWSAYDAAARAGMLTVPGGGAGTSRRIRMLSQTGCTVLFSTPTYALHMTEVAEREDIDLAGTSVRKLILAGEPGASMPPVRQRLEQAWDAKVYDHAGASEVGAYGIPCPEGRGVVLNEREFIAEVLMPGSGRAVAEGQTGELVLTNLGRWGCPVIRYRTGDLVRPVRHNGELLLERGILGRADHMMLVRGVNLHPAAIESVIRQRAATAEFRITVTRNGAMDEAEIEVEASPTQCQAIAELVRDTFGVRVRVRSVPYESLPRWQAKARRLRDLRK